MSGASKTNEPTVWVVITNSDLTEGRGRDVPIAVCELEATAMRMANKKGVMGSDARVYEARVSVIDGCMHIPMWCVNVHKPEAADLVEQSSINASRAAYAKALAAGLTAEEIKALCARKGQ